MTQTIEISGEVISGMAIRLFFLNTHYRKPINFTQQKLSEMEGIYRRWITKAEQTDADIHTDFLEALCDDMNTSKAIAIMHGYYKQKEYGRLFAAMKFLGLIPNCNGRDLLDLSDLKTTPPEHFAQMEAIGVTIQ